MKVTIEQIAEAAAKAGFQVSAQPGQGYTRITDIGIEEYPCDDMLVRLLEYLGVEVVDEAS